MVRRVICGTMLCALMAVAVEPGLPSKTSILTTALRAIGARNPDPRLRNPDDLAIRFLAELAALTGCASLRPHSPLARRFPACGQDGAQPRRPRRMGGTRRSQR